MKILFVCNNFYALGNGLSSSARTTVRYLRQAGMDVRLLAAGNPDPEGPQPEFRLEKLHFPLLQPIIEAQTFCFAKSDRKVIRTAVEWADVIHIEDPFVVNKQAMDIAAGMGKPTVATFHMHPENIMSSLGLGWSRSLNALLLKSFQKIIYDKCTDIQCPTESAAQRLSSFHFKARLHVISNGMTTDFESCENNPETDPYMILCIGRLSVEKDQYTLLRAMRYSRHARNIRLCFAGSGPKAKSIKKMAHRLYSEGVLAYEPSFGFYSQHELNTLSGKAYLYIHCAPVEVEGLSCLEALRTGVVPVIAESRLSATSQFALDSRSLFAARDPKSLAERIDWWIEHPAERQEMVPRYAASVSRYDIRDTIQELIEMYRLALTGNK